MSSVFTYLPVQETICSNLSVEEIIEFVRVLKITELFCPVPFFDSIEEIALVLPRINSQTIQAYTLIKQRGLNSALRQAARKGKNEVVTILLEMGRILMPLVNL